MLTILFLGDIVGEPGRTAVTARLPELKEKYALDFIIVNGENAAGGRGITGKITIDLLRAGVSVITTGDHIWDQKEIFGFIDTEPRLLRPINYPEGAPGHGAIVLETAKGKVGVINVQCRTFMLPILENPFHAMEAAITKMRTETSVIVVDVHGETTSEKIALARFLDGKVSAVLGTHTHVQTADEQNFFHGEQHALHEILRFGNNGIRHRGDGAVWARQPGGGQSHTRGNRSFQGERLGQSDYRF